MISRFFIERPIFANVLAIVTMLIGAVTVFVLPIEQYPQITPPTVQVTTTYPGADAKVLSDTVASPIEQEVNGVEGMLYMSSTCAADGSYNLTVTFDVGTNLDMAQVLVQNRVAIAQPKLPQEVQRQGITTKKKSTAIILVVALTSKDDRYDSLFLSNYATLKVKDELSRIYGVGDIQIFGSSNYGMRVWLDPEKLKARNLTTLDVLAAIQEQNIQVAAGQVGAPPAPTDQSFQYTVTTQGRLKDTAEFGEIIVKTSPGSDAGTGARLTRIKDVARVELGGQVYDQWCDVSGKAAAGVAVFQLPGANALDVADKVVRAMDKLKPTFPEALEYSTPYDTTVFVRESIREVYKTLFEAGVLVLIVILVFLQDWRATLVPATTVPVTIIGAFAAMFALGFSVNLLTLFGLILAIGIVVDDAIVIVENAAHHIDHDNLPAKEATIVAMGEVIGPIIGITLVLMAVFVPTAFLPGITGQLYRQFALTIAATAIISAINAVTLKPAQCATYLRPTPTRKNAFYRGFNWVYDRCERAYVGVVSRLVRHTAAMMLLFLALTVGTLYWFTRLPTGFLPVEDQGYAIVGLQLPDAASQARTRQVVRKVEEIFKKTPGLAHWVMIGGQSVLDQTVASNAATFYVRWAPYEERKTPETQQDAIINHLRGEFAGIEEAVVFAFPPPAIRGLGVASGFQIQLQDKENVGLAELQAVTDEMVRDGNAQSGLKSLNSTFRAGVPQLYADIDRVKAKSLDVPLDAIFGTLQSSMGSAYVNDFNLFGRTGQVRGQADQKLRLKRHPPPGGPEPRRGHAPAGNPGQHPRGARAADHHPVQPLPLLVDLRRGRGRDVLGPGHQADGADGRGQAPRLDGLRLDRDVVPGEEGRRPGGLRLRPGRPAGLPRPGRPVRELADARRRDPGRPPGAAGHGGRRGVPRHGQQYLHTDRDRPDHRPGQQERDPDRRVRPRVEGQGGGDHRGGRAFGAAPVPADPDDLLRLHPGDRPAGQRRGRRGRQPEGAGNGGLRGDARRHLPRRVLRARLLRRDPDLRRASPPPPGRPARRGRPRGRPRGPVDRGDPGLLRPEGRTHLRGDPVIFLSRGNGSWQMVDG